MISLDFENNGLTPVVKTPPTYWSDSLSND